MKKLTKLNLEELTEQMETMDCNEVESVVGGNWYYLVNENRIEQCGGGDSFKIANNRSDMQWGNGTSLSSASLSEQNAALRALGDMVGVGSNIPISATAYASSGAVSWASTGFYDDLTVITFNSGSNRYAAGNFYDLYSMMVHENIHVFQGSMSGLSEWEKDKAELQAYSAMAADPLFVHCSSEFQTSINNSITNLKYSTGMYYY